MDVRVMELGERVSIIPAAGYLWRIGVVSSSGSTCLAAVRLVAGYVVLAPDTEDRNKSPEPLG